jgi:predicted DsbA family dithiol-disulfide isomerase
MELSELFAGRELDLMAMQATLSQRAGAEGLPLAIRSRTCNSRLAQELGKWAESQGRGDPFRRAVYRAYFVEGRNIGLFDELMRISESVGLPVKEARGILAAGSFAPVVDADWERARESGITAVPTHLCGGKRLVGFGSYEDFLRLIGEG